MIAQAKYKFLRDIEIKRELETSDRLYNEFNQLLNSKVGLVECINNSSTSYLNFTFQDIITYKNPNADFIKTQLGNWKGDKSPYSIEGELKSKDEWYKHYKSQLTPAFTLTSYNEKTREAKEIINPYIIVDIDNIKVTEELFYSLNSLYFVVGSGKSFGGNGIWSVVKMPDEITAENFKDYFEDLSEWYKDHLNIELDKSCSNVNRLRVISPYDFEFNVNFEEPFTYYSNMCDTRAEGIFTSDTVEIISSVFNELAIETASASLDDFVYHLTSDDSFIRVIKVPPFISLENGCKFGLITVYANMIFAKYGESGYSLYSYLFPDISDKDKYWKVSRTKPFKTPTKWVVDELETIETIIEMYE